MDQNFSLMAQSRANYYTAGSPVQFVRVELLKGDVTGEIAVCLTFKNVGTEPLTGLVIHCKCKDAAGQVLCEDDFYYEQLNAQPGDLFGSDDAVYVSDTPVSSVEIEQDRAFLNGRGVDLRGYKRVRLQTPRMLPASIAKTLQQRTNNAALVCVPQDIEQGWFCACGAFHPNEENTQVCSECGGDRAYIKAALTRVLEEARQAAEQQQREINAVANGGQSDPAAATAAAANGNTADVSPVFVAFAADWLEEAVLPVVMPAVIPPVWLFPSSPVPDWPSFPVLPLCWSLPPACVPSLDAVSCASASSSASTELFTSSSVAFSSANTSFAAARAVRITAKLCAS